MGVPRAGVTSNIYYEGAAGAQKIKNILDSYRSNPPKEMNGIGISEFKDFGTQDLTDDDGVAIPKQDFYFLTLENGCQYAVRGSGTEPKIKFYLFAREAVDGDLPEKKQLAQETIEALKNAILEDADARASI